MNETHAHPEPAAIAGPAADPGKETSTGHEYSRIPYVITSQNLKSRNAHRI